MPSSNRSMRFLRQASAGAAFLAICLGSQISGQAHAQAGPEVDAASIREKLHVRDFQLQRIELPTAAPGSGAVTTTISLDGVAIKVELRPHSMRAPNYRLLTRGEGGKLTQIEPGPVRTYRGHIAQLPGSRVGVSIHDGQMSGLIISSGQHWGVQPLDDVLPGADSKLHVVYRQSDLEPRNGICGVDDAAGIAPPINDGGIAGTIPLGCLPKAEIAFDADYEYFQFFIGDPDPAAAAALDIEALMFNYVFPVYEDQVQIQYQITTTIIQTSPDDPYTSTNHSALLDEFQNYWNSNHQDVVRDVAHLMTGKEIDGNIIGVAYLATVCELEWAYGLSQSHFDGFGTTNPLERMILTAHELGHNWSAVHCNSSCSADCGIMCSAVASCAGPVDQFEGCSQALIINYRDEHAECLDAVTPAAVGLTGFLPTDTVADDIFGTSVALDGELAIVGAYGDDFENEPPVADDENAGSASIFRFDKAKGIWVFEAKLTASDGEDQDRFGISVDIVDHPDGTEFAVVGAYAQDVPELSIPPGIDTRGAGAVYVFRNTGGPGPASDWVQEVKLTAEDYQSGDNLGRSVAALRVGSEELVLATAHLDDTPFNAGSVYVFRNDNLGWDQEDKLRAADVELAAQDQFGSSLGVVYHQATGDIIAVIGAWLDNGDVDPPDPLLADLGSIYIFERGFPVWTQMAKLRASDPHLTDFFGFTSTITIGATGPTVIVGAPNVDLQDKSGTITNAGAAYIFADSGLGWAQLGGPITAPDAQINDRFGNAVAIHQNTALVGAPGDDHPLPDGSTVLADTGSAYLLGFDGSSWTHQSKITPSDPGEDNEFGFSVAVHNDHFLIGAWQYDASAQDIDNGAVYFGEPVELPDCNDNGIFDGCDIESGTSVDVNKNGVPDECDPPPACLGDISPAGGDGVVNVSDLLAIISSWGACPPPPTVCLADIAPPGGDGVVNVSDLLGIISLWGPCP
ncbi:MAG: M12 family metallo-peptidase [Phycisphaerales bacterium]|nr:M12 family metallo-peptidase [Phycisphaerales bacterium]MCI0629037.1 M12 family metallo-peptidase [Phycisphaerales bacterium]